MNRCRSKARSNIRTAAAMAVAMGPPVAMIRLSTPRHVGGRRHERREPHLLTDVSGRIKYAGNTADSRACDPANCRPGRIAVGSARRFRDSGRLRSIAVVPGAFLPPAPRSADFPKPMKEMEMNKLFIYAFAALFAVASVDAAAAKPAAGEQGVSAQQKGKKAGKKTERRVKKKVKNPDEPK